MVRLPINLWYNNCFKPFLMADVDPRYADTIKYLYEHLPMFQRVGASAFKKDLTNIRLLLEALGNPQDSWP